MKNILILSFVLILNACGPRTPQEELNESIDKMIILIDQGKSQELLVQYADLSEMKEEVTDIPEKKLKILKFYLLRAKEIKPVLSQNEMLATYTISSFKKPLKFIKSHNKWLLKNQ